MSNQTAATPDQVAQFYDIYNQLLRKYWDDNFHFGYWLDDSDDSSIAIATDRFTDLMISKLPVGPGDRVLDLGCGIGKPAIQLVKATGASVLGISINQDQVDLGTARAASEGVSDRASFELADALKLPFDDHSFDAVLAFESIVHMPRMTALREIARVLKPGGRVALTDLFKFDASDATAWEDGFLTPAVPRFSDYQDLVPLAGLEIDELLDVSAHTARTYEVMKDGITRATEEIKATFGPQVIEMLQAVMAPGGPTAEDVGCLIMVGHLPV